MTYTQSPAPVVVGIDGSDAALQAAQWAVDEAISRDVPLRLVHVTYVEDVPAVAGDDHRLAAEYAEATLRAAQRAVEATGKAVKLETAVLRGRPDGVLIDESLDADMVCVGTVGIGRFAREFLGSTAATLAEKAHCPVAVMRRRGNEPTASPAWIAVVVHGSAGDGAVVEQAMREAQLRSAPVLALDVSRCGLGEIPYDQLDGHLGKWARRCPEIDVRLVTARTGAADYLSSFEESVQLAVIGAADASRVGDLVGPHLRPIFGGAQCSVLVVR